MLLSVIIPLFNSETTLESLIKELDKALVELDYEVVLIDDGSTDSTIKVAKSLLPKYKQLKLIVLRKNFGEHNAVICGLNYCSGEQAVIIDDDLQNPPVEILKLRKTLATGYDVVYAQYEKKQHSLFRNWGGKLNHFFVNLFFEKPKSLYLNSFKIINRAVINEIVKYQGPFPYIDGLVLRCTNNLGTVKVNHHKRKSGKSGYTFKKLVSLFFNMFFNFSPKPLRFMTIIGAFIFLGSFVISLIFLIQKIYSPEIEAGWTSIIIAIMGLGGLQLLFIGLVGEYISKLYLDQNRTPQFVVKEIIE